ncbi:hypothetical protein SAMN05192555_11819 [Franzmannia pantelleriensis]|uniref:GGDEF domain-containing protein, diguanylate cyclase (C-di-GMP synthetase) or its enzymatically inactive variants n=1 Tax=Franzmannia pantelleriensis TaxID=48727 RepID=A0A1G9VIZ0_9GAMM|nr:hypothetical protein [Halomonas pantelleriensis]SDM72080.1 hypothetical protein SAMN05192555_11819 [Halomonas pantelleriensis]
MYKVHGFRLTLLTGALLCALLAVVLDLDTVRPLLWGSALWLMATAVLLQRSYRWPTRMPWQLVPSLLLATLVALEPEVLGAWLWAFAILMMLPQPRWMMALNVALASLAWWQVAATLPRAEASVSATLLALLLLAGAAHAVQLRPLWQRVSQRQRLTPGLRLWSAERLEQALARERTRSQRDPLHSELLLVRTSGHRCWRLAQRLAKASHAFEHCYRLDRRTLAITLVGRDPAAVRQRCQALLSMLPQRDLRARTLPLSDSERLEQVREALAEQQAALVHDDQEACS